MKNLIIIVIGILCFFLLECRQEPVSQSQKDYSLDEILSDSNWVEITDTVDVTDQIKCLAQNLLKWGLVLQSENDYRDLWNISMNEYPDNIVFCDGIYRYDSTKVKYKKPNINFNERTVLGFFITTGPAKWYRNIYKNENTKEYIYILHVERTSLNKTGDGYRKWVSIPKTFGEYKVIFDSTFTPLR
jgi:hypothetical protein